MRRRIPVPLLVVALATFGSSAAAQEITSPYRFVDSSQALGLFGGYALTDEGSFDLGPESAPTGGLRYAIRISGPFTFEAEAAFLPSERAVFDTAFVEAGRERIGEADLRLLLVQGALRFNITGPRTYRGLQPFLVFGGGAAIDVSDSDGAFRDELGPDVVFDFGTTFAAQIGVGIEWFASRNIAVRADVRDVFWQIEAPAAFTDPEISPNPDLDVPSEEWLQNFLFLLGLSYHF